MRYFCITAWLENHEDHYIHLHGGGHDAAIMTTQASAAKRIAMVDKLKNSLMIALLAYAVAIIVLAAYAGWNASEV
ncbi:MAG: hypothetical protein ACRD4O_06925 [Bryobacteraceae bacterium]